LKIIIIENNVIATMVNEMCALYIVEDTASSDVKIGISNNPKERKNEIELQYNVGQVRGISITWFFSRKEALFWESQFHKKFKYKHSPKRGGKEWFSLSEEEIKGFVDWMRESNKQNKEKIDVLRRLLEDQ
tara:strand:- start:210 stop:602 length:393 start_codon:yes stop_codon:yes gene_type:complete